MLPVALPRDVRGGSGSGRPRCGASARPPFVRSLPQVAQQIRAAQQKAALAGQAPPAWAIGARCQAVYSLDGEWYEAAVVGVTTAGDFVVKFAAYNNTEQVLRRAPARQRERAHWWSLRPPPTLQARSELFQALMPAIIILGVRCKVL